tara:strand:+ start:35429 stop:35671 length:243 start_codon:yes stop_codon:yes gene_type:complete
MFNLIRKLINGNSDFSLSPGMVGIVTNKGSWNDILVKFNKNGKEKIVKCSHFSSKPIFEGYKVKIASINNNLISIKRVKK